MDDVAGLEVYSTTDLIDELARRSTAVVVAICRPAEGEATKEHTCCSYRGGLNTALGLADRLKANLRDIAINGDPEDDDDGE
jgi:hypothetical protein